MLKIKVIDTFVENRSGTSKSGKAFNFNQQLNVFVELNGEVRKIPQILESGQQPYQVGNYFLDIEKHITVNQFGNLIVEPFANLVLTPVSSSVPISKDR